MIIKLAPVGKNLLFLMTRMDETVVGNNGTWFVKWGAQRLLSWLPMCESHGIFQICPLSNRGSGEIKTGFSTEMMALDSFEFIAARID